jgi:RecA/RadA recombinase
MPPSRIRTGLVDLDLLLDGGLPRGVVTELVGAGSSGRTTLACALAAAVTSAGDLAACIDLPDALDPAHASAAGIDLGRLLWVRPRDLRGALQAAEHVLDTGGFSLVLVDLDDPRAPRPMVPAGAWVRLVRAVARSRSAVLILGARRAAGVEDHDRSSAGTFAALRLETERRGAGFTGSAGPCPLFDGISSIIHLRKNRLGPPGAAAALFATAAV